MREGFPVTIVELLAAGERPTPAEAAAIVLAVCEHVGGPAVAGEVAPPVSSATVQLDADGRILVGSAPLTEDDQTLPLLGRLLLELLPVDPAGGERVKRLYALARRAALGEPGLRLTAFRFQLRALVPQSHRGEPLAGLVRRVGAGPDGRASQPWSLGALELREPAHASPPPESEDSDPQWTTPEWLRRVAVVGMTLLLLASAGAAFLKSDPIAAAATRLRPVGHTSKPVPPPPAWELVRHAK